MKARQMSLLLVIVMSASLCLSCSNREEEAQLRLSKAVYLQGIGKYTQAIHQLQDVMLDYPKTEAAATAIGMLSQIKVAMLGRAQQMKGKGKLAEAERLCRQIMSKYPESGEAAAASELLESMRERYDDIAQKELKKAFSVAQKYFADYAAGTFNLDALRYYGSGVKAGVTIQILDGRQEELVMMSEHASGKKQYKIDHEGRVEEVRRE